VCGVCVGVVVCVCGVCVCVCGVCVWVCGVCVVCVCVVCVCVWCVYVCGVWCVCVVVCVGVCCVCVWCVCVVCVCVVCGVWCVVCVCVCVSKLEMLCIQTQLCQLRYSNNAITFNTFNTIVTHYATKPGCIDLPITCAPNIYGRNLGSLEDNLKTASRGRNM